MAKNKIIVRRSLERDVQSRGAKMQLSALNRGRVGGIATSRQKVGRGKRIKTQRADFTRIKPNRLKKELANLPNFSSFLRQREQGLRNRLLAIPQNLIRTIYFTSSIPQLIQPIDQIVSLFRFFMDIDRSWFGNRIDDREVEDEKEEEPDIYEEPEEEDVVFLEEDANDIPNSLNEFTQHQQKLFKKVDSIISLLTDLAVKPYRKKQEKEISTIGNLVRNRTDNNRNQNINPLALLAAGLSGFVIRDIGSVTRGLEIGMGGIAGASLGSLLRNLRSNRDRRERRVRKTISNGIGGRKAPRLLRKAVIPIRRFSGRVGRIVSGGVRGVGGFLRILRNAVRVGGILSAVLIPVLEFLEANSELRQLQENYDNGTFRNDLINQPEARERALLERQSDIVVEGIIDTVGITAGAAIGGLLGVGWFSLLTGAAGAFLGGKLADWINENYSDQIASFIADRADPRALTNFFEELANFNLVDFIQGIIRSAPLPVQAALFPILVPLRMALDAIEDAQPIRRRTVIPEEPERIPEPRIIEDFSEEDAPRSNREIEWNASDSFSNRIGASSSPDSSVRPILYTPTRNRFNAVVIHERKTTVINRNRLVVA